MIDEDGVVKVMDLGLASLRTPDESHGGLTSTHDMMGSIDYIAPEQIEDARTVTAASDVYSLGCVLHHLLTGTPPFPKEEYPSDVSRLMAHMSLVPRNLRASRPETTIELEVALANSLEKRPPNRIQSASEFRRLLLPFTSGADVPNLVRRLHTNRTLDKS